MLPIPIIKKMLADRNLRQIATAIGVSYPTMLTLANKSYGGDHNYKTIKKISDYLIKSNKCV